MKDWAPYGNVHGVLCSRDGQARYDCTFVARVPVQGPSEIDVTVKVDADTGDVFGYDIRSETPCGTGGAFGC